MKVGRSRSANTTGTILRNDEVSRIGTDHTSFGAVGISESGFTWVALVNAVTSEPVELVGAVGAHILGAEAVDDV